MHGQRPLTTRARGLPRSARHEPSAVRVGVTMVARGRIRRNWGVVLIAVVVGAVAGLLVGEALTARYEASVSYVVTPAPGNQQPIAGDEVDTIAQTLSSVFESDRVASEVVEVLDLDMSASEVATRLALTARPRSLFLVGTYPSNDEGEALEVLTAASPAFIGALADVGVASEDRSEAGPVTDRVRVRVFESPSVTDRRSMTGLVRNLLIGAIAGALVGIGLATLREATRQRIDSPAQLEAATGLAVIDGTRGTSSAPAETLAAVARRTSSRAVVVSSARGSEKASADWLGSALSGLVREGWRIVRLHPAGDGRRIAVDGVMEIEQPVLRGAERGGTPRRGVARSRSADADLVIVDLPDAGEASLSTVPGDAGATIIVVASGRTARAQADRAARAARNCGLASAEMLLVSRRGDG